MKFAPFDAVRAIRDVPEAFVRKGDVLAIVEPGTSVEGVVYYLCELPDDTDSPSGVEGVPEDALEPAA
jgi:hypothetical protein